jgi:hypothetical protein
MNNIARFLQITVAALSFPAAAMASDIRMVPGGVQGNAPLHVDGTEDGGKPIIHRPAQNPSAAVRNGPGTMLGGAEDPGITYSGPGQGTHGGRRAPIVVGVDEGRPVLSY